MAATQRRLAVLSESRGKESADFSFWNQPTIRLLDSHLNARVDVSKEIWEWINLELWFREFIDTKVEPRVVPFHALSDSSPKDVAVVP